MILLKELIRANFLGFIFILSSSCPSLASDQNPEITRGVSQCLVNQTTITQCASLTQANTLTNKLYNLSESQVGVCLSNLQDSQENEEIEYVSRPCNFQPIVNLSAPRNNLFQPTTLRSPARRSM